MQLYAIGVTIVDFGLVQIVVKNVPNNYNHFLQYYTNIGKYLPLNELQINLVLEENRRIVKVKVKGNRQSGFNKSLYF